MTTDGCREKPSEIQEPIQGAERCLQEQRLWLRNLFTFLCVFHTKTLIHHQSCFSSTSPLLRPSPLPPMSSRHRRVAGGTQPRGGSSHLPLPQQHSQAGIGGASAGLAAQAAGREWLSAQLPFTFRFHNAPMRLFNQNHPPPKKKRACRSLASSANVQKGCDPPPARGLAVLLLPPTFPEGLLQTAFSSPCQAPLGCRLGSFLLFFQPPLELLSPKASDQQRTGSSQMYMRCKQKAPALLLGPLNTPTHPTETGEPLTLFFSEVLTKKNVIHTTKSEK